MRTLSRVAVAVLALAALASQAGAVQLRHQFRPGESHTYKTTMKGRGETQAAAMPEGMRMEMSMEMVTTEKVLSVSEDGKTGRIEHRVASGSMTMNFGEKAQTMQVPQERTVISMDNRGKVLKVESEEGTPSPALGASAQGMDWAQMAAAMAFPEQDLKPNDTWDFEAPVQVAEGTSMKVKAHSRLLKLLTYKGRPCAEIRTAFEIPLESMMPQAQGEGETPGMSMEGKVSGEVTWYFDHAKGLVIDESGTVKMLMKMSFTMGEQTMESSTSMIMNVKSVLQQ
jgi:hypothetical protein